MNLSAKRIAERRRGTNKTIQFSGDATKLLGTGLTPLVGRAAHAQHFAHNISNTPIVRLVSESVVTQLR